MHVLLVTDQYPPEIRSISSMISQLAEGLSGRGHQVTVLASYPRARFVAGPLSSIPVWSQDGGVTVVRVPTFHYRKSYLIRGLGELLLPFVYLPKLITAVPRKIDAVLMYSPPLTLTILCRIIKRFYKTRFIFNVQDIFPQNAIDLGIMRSAALIKVFEHIERKAYRAADHITTHSETSARFLVDRKAVPAEKISTVYNWIDLSAYEQARPTGRYRRLFDVEDKFVFLMAGFLGPSQQLDFVLRVAEEVSNIPEICFLLLGEGTEKKKLLDMKRQRKLDNVRFAPFVSREEYPSVVKDMDVGMACLSSRNTTPVYPGKIVGFMASSKPVLAFLHKESDGHAIIREAGCGHSSISGDHRTATRLVIELYEQKQRASEYGRRGFEFASRHFSRDRCIDALEKVLYGTAEGDVLAASAQT